MCILLISTAFFHTDISIQVSYVLYKLFNGHINSCTPLPLLKESLVHWFESLRFKSFYIPWPVLQVKKLTFKENKLLEGVGISTGIEKQRCREKDTILYFFGEPILKDSSKASPLFSLSLNFFIHKDKVRQSLENFTED